MDFNMIPIFNKTGVKFKIYLIRGYNEQIQTTIKLALQLLYTCHTSAKMRHYME